MRFNGSFNLAACVSAICVILNSPAFGVVTFSFDYSFGAAEFNDPAGGIGDTRKASLESAATMVGNWFDHTAEIQMTVTSSTNAGSGLLASAGSIYSAGAAGFVEGVVGTKILSGVDTNTTSPDGALTVNFFHNWDYDDSIAPGSFDFKSTIIHELLHAVGFTSLIDQNGNDVFGFTMDESGTDPGLTDGGVWAKFDDFLTDAAGNPVIDDTTFNINQTMWDTQSIGGTSPANGLFFDGPNAKAANGGNPVGVYTPTAWEDGSSVSHLDTDNAALTNLLMTHSSTTGPDERTLSPIEVGILTDLGFTVIPEPSTITLLLGSGLLATRRRRRAILA